MHTVFDCAAKATEDEVIVPEDAEGAQIHWQMQPGDQLEIGDVVARLLIGDGEDASWADILAPASGRLSQRRVDDLAEVEAGDVLATVDTFGRVLTAEEIEDRGIALPPPPTLDEVKAARKATIRGRQAELFAAGWTHDFGAAGTHTLDLRNADDKANWTLLLIKTQGMIAAGAGAMPVRIRTAANDTIEVSATVANAAMAAFLAWGENMLSAKWDLDAAIDAAADNAAVAAIDTEAGWP